MKKESRTIQYVVNTLVLSLREYKPLRQRRERTREEQRFGSWMPFRTEEDFLVLFQETQQLEAN